MTAPEHTPPLDLSTLGWDDSFHDTFAPYAAEHVAARVSRVDRGACDALAADGPMRLTFSGAVLAAGATDPVSTPCVGDWVAARIWPDGRVTVEAVLPRRTAFVRAGVTPGTSHGQVLATNVDLAVVVEGLHPEPDLGRIERFLALAWESGATPMVVLTKADLVPDAEQLRADVAAAAPGVDVLTVSSTTGEGMEAVREHVLPGRTLALLGPSGAGKSTLTNAISGDVVMFTRALRADGKGRHTTVHRELVVLPGGGLVVDTPGLRSVGLTDVSESLDLVFADVEALAGECRFGDCAHETEPGCAVRAALDSGELPERRWTSYVKLQREARWMAMRHDARLRAEERSKWKRITKEYRNRPGNKP
ncbi:MAG: ribosome biosis GTPase / thiamine phosphate phosphatase [Actinomycetota bacterium]|nr:ribosome biosis GTPase / thiamine phosphate phosphatase [Actinomycetota bacterium]